MERKAKIKVPTTAELYAAIGLEIVDDVPLPLGRGDSALVYQAVMDLKLRQVLFAKDRNPSTLRGAIRRMKTLHPDRKFHMRTKAKQSTIWRLK